MTMTEPITRRPPTEPEVVNGCLVIHAEGVAPQRFVVIDHPAGFMAYSTARLCTRRTFDGAVRYARRVLAEAFQPLTYDEYDALLQGGCEYRGDTDTDSGIGQWAVGPYKLTDGRFLTVRPDGTAVVTVKR